MRQMTKTLVVCLLTAAAAAAQGYSQPVREMEKEARSAVRGLCRIQYNAGYAGLVAQADCTLSDLNQTLGTTIPQGKVLVIEDISALCNKAAADKWAGIWLTATGYDKYLALVSQASYPSGTQVLIATTPAKFYGRGGDKVTANINLTGVATMDTTCTVKFAGHLVTVQ